MRDPQKRDSSRGRALLHDAARLWRYTDGHAIGFLAQHSRQAMQSLVLAPVISVPLMVLLHGVKSMGSLGGIAIALAGPVVTLGAAAVNAVKEILGDRKATWLPGSPGAAAA